MENSADELMRSFLSHGDPGMLIYDDDYKYHRALSNLSRLQIIIGKRPHE